jgi:hypothetical protein
VPCRTACTQLLSRGKGPDQSADSLCDDHDKWISPCPNVARFVFSFGAAWHQHQADRLAGHDDDGRQLHGGQPDEPDDDDDGGGANHAALR